MTDQTLRKVIYRLKRYTTLNTVVILIGAIVVSGWVWGSITTMQRNYALQKEVDARERKLALTQLEVDTMQLQKNYYASDEYKELAARERLGLAAPGEKVLLLPPNSAAAKATNITEKSPTATTRTLTNFEQWMLFLFGGSAARLQN
ncbi:MAG: septum formation initiator family protein [Candidatus Saccharimonas aalborgensis]|jgi:cell division protein FtsB|uniref:Septum formation initiator n=1 Tax=Candidatus Saccharimonas aalborgensis TaxID=1332188 RepID=R4PMF9_9BACT|nr:septum formation initiator family protein [Candidatus Saccharimonas aalborgensis]MBP7775392.1 septum formation initiator family protein [Candidatus Saccharimonas sp.]QQR50851.1 MAG: septum formation initiator family protein [Candidatus Saccharibacteria bacterium]AGL62084.1 hypothetical protein L336_0376 [Candidatus Saccharimonas aalborgensis]QQS68598.1 MAG: septum formation initiator family protein [Candidatus Saccharibacteria bacterium]QQS70898.1 MAG: septum formation initiator family prot